MSTELVNIEVEDFMGNKQKLGLLSFYGGIKKGHCLQISITSLGGFIRVILTKEQALELAKSILEKFE